MVFPALGTSRYVRNKGASEIKFPARVGGHGSLGRVQRSSSSETRHRHRVSFSAVSCLVPYHRPSDPLVLTVCRTEVRNAFFIGRFRGGTRLCVVVGRLIYLVLPFSRVFAQRDRNCDPA